MTVYLDTLSKIGEKDGIHIRYLSGDKLFIYWYIASAKWKVIKRFFKENVNRQIIRVYDVTREENAAFSSFLDIHIPIEQNYWTIKGIKEHKVYIFELGVLINNQFFPVHRSQAIGLKQTENMKELTMEEKITLQLFRSGSRGWNEQVSTYSFYENVGEWVESE